MKAESKHAGYTLENNTVHNSSISSGDIVPVVPPVPQGTNDYNRLGDSITPTLLRLRGLVSTERDIAVDNRVLMVRVMVLSSKTWKSANAVLSNASAISGSLLKPNIAAGPTICPFLGNQRELFFPINNDLFRVHYDKTFEIAPASGTQGLEQQPKSAFRWKCDVPLPARLTYDGTSPGDTPTNFAPFYCIGYSYADGTGYDSVQTRLITTVQSELYFKDL